MSTDPTPNPSYAPFAHAPNEGEHLRIGPATIIVRADAETTGGAFSLFEEPPPLLDTPTHVHEHEDETYIVLDGEHEFVCGDRTFRAQPGAVVFLPRTVPHSHRRVVPGKGHLMFITVPAGLEGFFRTIDAAARSGEPEDEAYSLAAGDHGIRWLT